MNSEDLYQKLEATVSHTRPPGGSAAGPPPHIPLNRATRSSIAGCVLNILFVHPLCFVSGVMMWGCAVTSLATSRGSVPAASFVFRD